MNREYLESLSLFDLYELRKFYRQLSNPGVETPPRFPKINHQEAEKHYEMIEEAITNRLFTMDVKLFGSTIKKENSVRF